MGSRRASPRGSRDRTSSGTQERPRRPRARRRPTRTAGSGSKGFGAERVVTLKLEGDHDRLDDDRRRHAEDGSVPGPRASTNKHGPGTRTIYGADFTYTAAPSRPDRRGREGCEDGSTAGRRRGPELPVRGVRLRRHHDLKTKTDAQGRFRMTGLPKGKGNALIVVPNDEQPYFMQEVRAARPAGLAPVAVEVGIAPGDLDRGEGHRRGDREAGRRGLAALHAVSREHVRPGASRCSTRTATRTGSGFRTATRRRPTARFRLVGLPGRAIVGAVVHGQALSPGRRLRNDQGHEQGAATSRHTTTRSTPASSGPP